MIIKSVDYSYSQLCTAINEICLKYKFVKRETVGKSLEGRNITALSVGNGTARVLMTASFHGSEHITANVLLMFFEEFCDALSKHGSLAGIRIEKALMGRSLTVIPVVNPDGCEIAVNGVSGCGERAESIRKMCRGDYPHYNANLRGVDINHNFDAGWEILRKLESENGIYGPSRSRFGGYEPESEPETSALCNYCRKNRFRHALALHSQGEVIYWDYDGIRPEHSRRMAEIMASVSGYALDYPQGLAVGGGFKDWFIKEFRRPAFTVEIGKGTNPLPIESAYSIYERICEMLTLCAIM